MTNAQVWIAQTRRELNGKSKNQLIRMVLTLLIERYNLTVGALNEESEKEEQ